MYFSMILVASCLICSNFAQNSDTSITTTESSTLQTSSSAPTCPEFCTFTYDRGGRGKAPFRMWYFDFDSKECKNFRYVGRSGNKNRFRKKQDCESICKTCTITSVSEDDDGDLSKSDSCKFPYSQGTTCDDNAVTDYSQLKLMWRFDSDKQSCLPFAYLGCGGNDNRFESNLDCEAACL